MKDNCMTGNFQIIKRLLTVIWIFIWINMVIQKVILLKRVIKENGPKASLVTNQPKSDFYNGDAYPFFRYRILSPHEDPPTTPLGLLLDNFWIIRQAFNPEA